MDKDDRRSNNHLVIATWNANGVIRGRAELECFLEDQDVSVMLLSETHLKESQSFSVRGFQTFRKDRGQRGGGVAALVRNDLQARRVALDSTLEAVAAEVMVSGRLINFVAVYISQKKVVSEEELRGILVGPRTIIGGDLNAKNTSWGCRRTNKAGKTVDRFVRETRGLEVIAPEVATSIPGAVGRRGDVLDIFLAYRMASPWEVRTKFALASDHFPVTARIGGDPLKSRSAPRVDWRRFREKTGVIPCPEDPLQEDSLSREAESFTRELQEALRESTYHAPLGKGNHLGLTRREKEVIQRKNRAKQEWAKWRREADRRIYRYLEREVKSIVSGARTRKIRQQVERANKENGNCWQVLRTLGRNNTANGPFRVGNKFVYQDKEKAEVAADYLEEVFTNTRATSKALARKAEATWKKVKEERVEQKDVPVVSQERVMAIIRSKRKRSAPGEDGMSYQALTCLHERAERRLTRIIEASCRFGKVPSGWKTATIVLIPKGDKDPGQVSNLRPISLINSMAKVVESFLQEEIRDFVVQNGILPGNQFGFRAGLSATHQAAHLAEAAAKEDRPRRRAAVALLDLEKAYDRVWREGLVHKLVERRFPQWIVRWISDWLTDRKFRVKMRDETSGWRRALEGLPQGSPLSPGLFNIFVSDLPAAVRIKGTQIFQFADDTAVLAVGNCEDSTLRKVEVAIAQINKFCCRWKLAINDGKTEAMMMGKRKPKQESIKVGATRVKLRRSVKYLGIAMDNQGRLFDHVRGRGGLAKTRLKKLSPVLKGDSGVDLTTRRRILEMIAQPTAFYGKELAIRGSEKTKESMRTLQRVLIRRCLGAPWFVPNRLLWEAAGVQDICEAAEDSRERMIEAIRSHDNEEVRALARVYRR